MSLYSYNNSTELGNGTQSENNVSNAGQYIISSAYVLIAVVSVVSNSMFCIILYKKKSPTAKATEYLFLNLAATDMLSGILLIVVPGFVIPIPDYPIPHVGLELFCRLIWSNALFFMLGFISVWTLLAICVDRWFAIAMPFSYKEICTKRKALITIIIIWIANIGLAMDNFLDRTAGPNGTKCVFFIWVNPADKAAVVTALQVVRIFIPSLLIAVVYLDIGRRILHSSYRKKVRVEPPKNTIIRSSQRDALIRKQVTVMSFIAAVVFLICWLPNEIYYTMAIHDPRLFKNITIRRITKLLTGLNSTLNPLIYAISNKYYREGFIELLRCRITVTLNRVSILPSSFANNSHINTVVKAWEKESDFTLS
ncbi:Galanin receptor type 2 [Trichoplax sp. H2]|uniref:G-protein coupled receptors family 1 profile domain-containing protein n=1 Tax=Trichoplax adhaerens TaxID=10228 RepID=B3RNW6_TRIAD|nr:hypothetical protein TRIADDRAFT_53317 [Trichoplax adhaerens]EDV28085.1 hypothetical protein TRIADDRAFT_53317 [Trichoplax adhaerens]RDD39899.1 Galanin receptor type 2 [Trichoplax sp. H2]|eukprot:XP_002109919.1 hypothetical protein TRIADDRAFT_53317 [Trichoplax adhaerens]